MPEYFDFTATHMSRVLVWIRFPNLPLKCWSPTCLSKIASVIGKPIHYDMLTTLMSRLSYARVLIEVDLLVDLPNSINFVLPNGMLLLQLVVYKSIPRFCKHCQVIGHTDSACTRIGSNKRKKHTQEASTPAKPHRNSGCFSFVPSVETVAMEQQQVYSGRSHGEPCMDPIRAEVAAMVDSWVADPRRKRLTMLKLG
jgi:hypothetical protein